jgi:glycosyltransferase involved in cell wall biosynthesis
MKTSSPPKIDTVANGVNLEFINSRQKGRKIYDARSGRFNKSNAKIMTKIYFFANSHFLPGNTSTGGIKKFCEILRRVKGFKKVIITSKIGFDIYKKEEIEAKYFLVSKEEKEKNVILTYLINMTNALWLNLEISKGDVLYCTSDFLPDVLPAFVYKLRNWNTPWVANIYHVIPPPFQRDGRVVTNFTSFLAQRLSFQMIRRNSDLIFVLNSIIVKQLVELGFPKDRIYVTGAGVDLAHINQISKVEKAEYDACFLGRLHPVKGIFDLVDIWELVVSKKENARLAVIYAGTEDMTLALMKRIKERKLEANIFMLPLTGDDALSMVKSSKVFIFPSHEEGWGIAVCEAMACGLPVIAWNLPVYREIFPQGMITVPFGNFKRFAEMTLKLLEDSELRHSMSKDALGIASKYSWDKVAGREMALIESLKLQKQSFPTLSSED